MFLFQVRGLEFNPSASNLLASGADEGDIIIWDLSNPTAPSHFPSLRVTGIQMHFYHSLYSFFIPFMERKTNVFFNQAFHCHTE